MFSLFFEPNILEVGAEFAAFQAALAVNMELAGKAAGEIVRTDAIAHMHWQHPTGQLEGSLKVQQESPMVTAIGSDLPYARRREEGFSGMTDSRGRYFANDPGEFYMTLTLEDNAALTQVADIYIAATLSAWEETVGAAAGIASILDAGA